MCTPLPTLKMNFKKSGNKGDAAFLELSGTLCASYMRFSLPLTCQDVCVSGGDGLNLHNTRLCSLVGEKKVDIKMKAMKQQRIRRCITVLLGVDKTSCYQPGGGRGVGS